MQKTALSPDCLSLPFGRIRSMQNVSAAASVELVQMRLTGLLIIYTKTDKSSRRFPIPERHMCCNADELKSEGEQVIPETK